MSGSLQIAPLAEVRHLIASAVLNGRTGVPNRIGDVVLRPHQGAAASKLAAIVRAHGGGMLAEPVGLGKTYTALAVAAHLGTETLVVAPAALREMWIDSLQRCGMAAEFVSHESLSRGARPAWSNGIVIVDESHRLRTPTTRRYSLAAELCRSAHVVLLSATPVQNATADLRCQLALFLGRAVAEMPDEQLVAYVVRQGDASHTAVPRLDGPHLVTMSAADDCVDRILALAPPVEAKGETIAAALLCYGLVHQWMSSRAALVRALLRRQARGIALTHALESGCRPTRSELSAWTHAGDSVQLAFAEIVAGPSSDAEVDPVGLRVAVERHVAGVRALLRYLSRVPDPDDERAAALRLIRRAHPGERIIAFCHYAETVNALRSRLSKDGGVAALTSAGGRVAGGRLTRADVLLQFTRRPADAREVSRGERIDLLLTTDLLSEGLNLQEASVIVHLDLPWNPARLDQRVGRALRMGSPHSVVTVYALAPPADAQRMLAIERRLREKLEAAQHTVGVAHRILPTSLSLPLALPGLAEQAGALDATLRTWVDAEPHTQRQCAGIAACADSAATGFLAALTLEGETHLVANIGNGVDARVSSILAAAAQCNNGELPVDAARLRAAQRQLELWLATRAGASSIDLRAAARARFRRPTLARVAQALARAPRHRRAHLVPLADAARTVATVQLSEGAERVLETLVQADLPDEAWLRAVATFGELNARRSAPANQTQNVDGIRAIILLGARTGVT